ncbi:MAG: Rpn family recombination-promoting nuclease/putative transposase [Treponema sp.]|nr:Rpn family recombination-promoting nuclease/putative transposase [Treponema sp.]
MKEKIPLFYKLKSLFNRKTAKITWQKPVDELTFADDYLFGALMHQKDVCAGVIERLLNMQPMQITYPEIQKTISPFYDTKGIRLDVLANDGKTLYNIEMQTSRTSSLPLRMRYYQGLLDVDSLMKGSKYESLCQSYVIFICTKDPFSLGRPVYTFVNTCQEDTSLKLGDKSIKVLYNASAWESDGNDERSGLLRYIDEGTATTAFTQRLEKLAQEVKT